MSSIDFKQAYSRETFLSFLEKDFLPDDLRIERESIDYSAKYTQQVTRLGECQSLKLDVIEIIHASTHDARVGLSKEAFRLLLERSKYNRALILFVPKDNPETYRFSLVSIEITLDEHKIRRSYSNPRRYSFLLGEEAKVHTPTQYLVNKGKVRDVEDLKKRFSVEVLTKEFYAELSDWYSWAISEVKFPGEKIDSTKDEKIEHNSKNVIRLLTRLLFVWFLKQKHLIPDEFFNEQYVADNLLKNFAPNNPEKLGELYKSIESKYYKAILQNLFFATLNCPITAPGDGDTRERGFRKSNSYGQHRDANYLMRYEILFKNPSHFLDLVNKQVPFLNGGLFDCLDNKSAQPAEYIDGFSDNLPAPHQLIVPDFLFFGEEQGKNIDLTWFYGDSKKKKNVNIRGLIDILETYNFTIEENTPYDQEVSLDPELLGKVFENLLASYNPETQSTARKQTGSFYTPREIVQYMVDESLTAHLKHTIGDGLEGEFRQLMNYTDEEMVLTEQQKSEVIKSLFSCKVMDPACGSGAFPVGMLQQMVHILSRLDPENRLWKEIQKKEALAETSIALDEDDETARAEALAEIERNFNNNLSRPDYARKLYLIENCIYGVDIQPIAVQISKLRFFISLVVEQNATTDSSDNFGIRPLPNLEAKFVAANTLIGLDKQGSLSETQEVRKEQETLKHIRHKIFSARSPETKRKLKERDKETREKIAQLLETSGFLDSSSADKMAKWDPYDQNTSAPFFDSEWMFGVDAGFDIVIGNPPYLKEGRVSKKVFDGLRNSPYYQGKMDLWYMFACVGIDILVDNGTLCFIATNNWVTSGGASKMRNKVISDSKILQLVDFGNFMIFESASIQTMVMLFSKDEKTDNYSFDYRKLRGDTKLTDALDLLSKNKNNKAEYLNPSIIRAELKNTILTFSSHNIILGSMSVDATFLTDKEVAQGIVPNPDIVNSRNITKIPQWKIAKCNINIGEGVFVVDKNKFANITENESKYVKPLVEPTDTCRFFVEKSSANIIYLTKENYKNDAPRIVAHLEQYREIMDDRRENRKGRLSYYNLHWPRESSFFEQGEKILSVRKCQRPTFSYTEEEAYVMMAFNVIKTNRINLKYLTGLLNSKLIAFWLKNKGKMQGNNYQIDKEPLLGIPLRVPSQEIQGLVAKLVEFIIHIKKSNEKINEYARNEAFTSLFEAIIDAIIYELYFPDEIQSQQMDVIHLVAESLKQINSEPVEEQIIFLFNDWNDDKNEIRNRVILQETRSKSVSEIIKSMQY
ncbi:Eco57I restriction-modification methylase domain-containing protein [Proteiniphilum saccharofermentans]|uniref:Eco57I restriction-modification methylase domain-containing protein n=1 Tax=Proteiniphilum saccharofermentans TaxID=1642647 RepID=UPI0028A66328|nr:N-6 DNA methylase [Proteiniphilum saccharofermentans]